MKQKLLFLLTALMLLTTGNVWGEGTYIWTFKDNTSVWTTAKVSQGNAVTYDQNGVASGAAGYSGYGVTFNFTNTSNDEGGQVKNYYYSSTDSYTTLWWNYDGNIDNNNVSISVPSGFKVTFNMYSTKSRPMGYKIGTSASATTYGNLEYSNMTGDAVTITVWGTNTRNSGRRMNALLSIVLEDCREEFNTLKTYADALVDVENDNGAATTTLSNAIATQNSVVENATSQTEIDNATAALRTAMDEFVSVATPTKGHQFDLTYMLTNPNVEGIVDWDDAAAQGWFTDIPRTDLGTYNNFAARTNLNSDKNAIERYTSNACTTAGTFALYQKVTLPSGNYLFKSFALANAATTIVMAAGNTEGDAVTTSDFTEYSVNFTQASQSEVKLGTKISSTGTNTCNWTAITGIKLYKTSAPTFTLSNGQAKQLTFHNKRIGENTWHNWMIDVVSNEERVAAVRADWWDDQVGNNENFVIPYTHSYDGGFNSGSNVWEHFSDDMLDASVKLSVSYEDGSLYIIGTMEKANHIYYVNYIKASLSGNVDVYLYGNNAKLSNISSIDASVKTTTVQPGAVKVTIPISGYGSLASAYGLDFSSVEGLTAYVVTDITNTQVKLTSVSELPANSGVILKGTGGNTYDIPMKADATYEGENKLYAAVTAYDCAANEVYILQSGLFHLVTAASTVPAGKAYLLAEDVPNNQARSLVISEEEDPTAITAIEAAESEAGALKDGKYLIGNKIVLVKNGVKYSANGQKLN